MEVWRGQQEGRCYVNQVIMGPGFPEQGSGALIKGSKWDLLHSRTNWIYRSH
jgi:hypothetical protein